MLWRECTHLIGQEENRNKKLYSIIIWREGSWRVLVIKYWFSWTLFLENLEVLFIDEIKVVASWKCTSISIPTSERVFSATRQKESPLCSVLKIYNFGRWVQKDNVLHRFQYIRLKLLSFLLFCWPSYKLTFVFDKSEVSQNKKQDK